MTGDSGGEIKATVTNGVCQLKSVKLGGGDIELGLSGTIKMANGFKDLDFNLNGKIKFINKKPFEKFLAFIQGARADGSYPIKIVGSTKRRVQFSLGSQNFSF